MNKQIHPVPGCAEAAGEAHETEAHSWTGLKKRELYPAERSCHAHSARVLPIPCSSPWKGWKRGWLGSHSKARETRAGLLGEPHWRAREQLGLGHGSRAAAAMGQVAKPSGARDECSPGESMMGAPLS